MIARQKLFGVIIILALLTAGVAAYTFLELSQVRDAHAAALRERDDLRAKLEKSEQAVSSANERLAQARLHAETLKEDLGRLFSEKSIASPSPASSPTSTPSMLPSTSAPTVRATTSALDNRYGKSMFVAGRYRGPRTSFTRNPPSLKSLDTIYPSLFRQLKLTPEQAAQFKTLAIEIADRFSDLDRRAKAEGKRPSDPAMQRLYAEVDAEYRKKLIELIGADSIPTVEHFAETLFLRDAVAYFAGELFYTDAPLPPSHADRLVEIMSQNLRDPNGRLDIVFADSSAMKSAAQEFLSPVQLAVWVHFIDDLAKTSFSALQPRPGSGMMTR